MDKNYCVYIHKNKTNGKVYVGLTSMVPEKRWKNGHGYLGKKKDGSYAHPYFASAILKYGWENFEHIIYADNLTMEEAANLEIELIFEYNATDRKFGYNIQNGGYSTGKIGNESKKKISNSLKEYFKTHTNPMQGRKQSDDSKYKSMVNNKTRRDVVCYDIETNQVVGVYLSVNQASRETGISLSSVSACCNGRLGSAYGLKFQFIDEPHEYVHLDTKNKKVAQIDIETNEVIQVFPSTREAMRVTGINNIASAARGTKRHKTAGGFKWKYI